MAFETITMAILTHPVHALFGAVILLQVSKPFFAKLALPRLVRRELRAAA